MTHTKETTDQMVNEISPVSHAIPEAPILLQSKAQSNSTIPVPESSSEIQEDGVNDNTTKSRSRFRMTMIIIALYLSLFIAALDATIVATAVPTITADLKSPSGYAWIGGAYLIANAAGGPIWAKLSDIWGRKPILLLAVLIFIASSIICALSINMKMLIIGRSFQGVAGGGLILMVNIVISDLFSMRQRSLFLGLCEGIWAIAGAIGPVLGGALTDLATWRWCWWINLPSCGVAFALLLLFLDVHNPRTPFVKGIKAIDWAGSMSILAFTLLLLIGLDFGGNAFPWSSPKVICLIVFGTLCLILFFYSERTLAAHPLIPLDLFRQNSNIAALAVGFFHGISFIAPEYYMPLYFQSVKSATPLHSGVLLVPLIVTTAFIGILVGVFIHQTGTYLSLIYVGTTLLTLGISLLVSINATTSIGCVIAFQVVAGFGSGLLFEPPLIAMQAFVEQSAVATATSTYAFIRCIALAISIIIGGVVFQNSMDAQSPRLKAAGLSPQLLELFSGRNAAANTHAITVKVTDATQLEAVKEAYALSMRNMWIMYACFAFLGVVAGVFVKSQKLSREHTETVTGLKEKETLLTKGEMGGEGGAGIELRDRRAT